MTLKILTDYFAKTRRIGSGIVVGLIEIMANLLALCDLMRGKSYSVWSISTTTKTEKEL